jgi:hypothetical protein
MDTLSDAEGRRLTLCFFTENQARAAAVKGGEYGARLVEALAAIREAEAKGKRLRKVPCCGACDGPVLNATAFCAAFIKGGASMVSPLCKACYASDRTALRDRMIDQLGLFSGVQILRVQ